MHQITPSVVRTVVPMIVGWLLGQLAARGLDLDPGLVEQVVTWAITGLYYAGVRLLETRGRQAWGWLLGLPRQPLYGYWDGIKRERPGRHRG